MTLNNFPSEHEHVEIRKDCKLCGAKAGSQSEQILIEEKGICTNCYNT